MREAGRPGLRKEPRSGGVLEVREAAVAFAGRLLFEPLSFDLGNGEAAVVTGPSGSGKSTLLRAIARLESLASGEVRLWGEARYGGSHRIGLTLDGPRLWPWMKAMETVRCIAGLNGMRLERGDARSLLSELNLDRAHDMKAADLSQGMARRVQLAGALAVGRDLLLLDEPTASLDESNGKAVWESLERRRRAGVPVVVATHDDEWEGTLDAAVLVELESE